MYTMANLSESEIDEIVENRNRLKRFEDNPNDDVTVEFKSEERTTKTRSVSISSSTTKEIINNNTTVKSESISSDQLSTIYLRDLLIDMLVGSSTPEQINNYRFGTGNKTTDKNRRTVQTLDIDITSKLNTSTSINVDTTNNTITIDTTITNIDDISDSISDISEIGIETDSGNLAQYITDI